MDFCNAFCLAATSSGSGKTTLSLGLLRALAKRGLNVRPFKCGPDYIDPEFHKAAVGVDSVNLDLWMMGRQGVCASFARRLEKDACAVVEGVMGLFDGVSATSIEGSSADLALALDIPVILVLDASGMAGTVAALVEGCAKFVPKLKVAGVIANFVSSETHRELLAEALRARDLPPLLGCLPAKPEWELPERHLGLVPEQETVESTAFYDSLAEGVERHIDLESLLRAVRIPVPRREAEPPRRPFTGKLGVALDDAFHFYYSDNLEALKRRGVELVFFSPMRDKSLPADVGALYFGGGYPEVFAGELSANISMREAVKAFVSARRPVYAECGGLMYLCRSLQDDKGVPHKMCGVFDCEVEMGRKLERLGYRETRTLKATALGPAGLCYRGHEFHWSKISERFRFPVAVAESRGVKGAWTSSALLYEKVYASYVHAHFAFNDAFLDNFARMCGKKACS